MTSNISVIRQLDQSSRKFYLIHLTKSGTVQVFDYINIRDAQWRAYLRDSQPAVRLAYETIAEVEIFSLDNETVPEYRLQVPLTEQEQATALSIRKNKDSRISYDTAVRITEEAMADDVPAVKPLRKLMLRLGNADTNYIRRDDYDTMVEEIVMHPDFTDGEFDRAVQAFKECPSRNNFVYLQGCMLVYQWLNVG